jgi:hypothetical protein
MESYTKEGLEALRKLLVQLLGRALATPSEAPPPGQAEAQKKEIV